MNCVYHPANLAHVRCTSCGRGLCPACDHRIRGIPHCQDCIVAGVELLGQGAKTHERRAETPAKARTPIFAALLALVPGLGAAYNGQTGKALLHFFSVITLWHLGDILSFPFAQVFMLGGLGFFLYTIFDAKKSAERHGQGADLEAEDKDLRASLRRHAPLWASALVGVGFISFVHFAFDTELNALWPILLVAAGFYLLRGFRDLARSGTSSSAYRRNQAGSNSIVQRTYETTPRDYAGFDAGRFDRRR